MNTFVPWIVLASILILSGCVSDNEAGSESSSMTAGGAGGLGGDSTGAGGSVTSDTDGGLGGEGGQGAASDQGGLGGSGGEAGAGGVGGEGGMVPEPMPRPPAPAHFGGDRPAEYFLPRGHDASAPMALVLSLHGYSGNAQGQNAYFGLSEHLRDRGALLITPNGRVNRSGLRFWHATDFCCDFEGAGDIDVEYLRGLIEEAMEYFPIDPERISVIGHSNGGFMAYRLACDASDLVTNIVSLAGTSWADAGRCGETEPVSVLQIHGTWDTTIRYAGRERTVGDPDAPFDVFACRARECADSGTTCQSDEDCPTIWACMNQCGWGQGTDDCRQICYLQGDIEGRVYWMDDFVCMINEGCADNPAEPFYGYASAEEVVTRWRVRNECDEEAEDSQALDLVRALPGVDTTATRWPNGRRGTEANLWRINRGSHGPGFRSLYGALVVEWMMSTPRSDGD